MGKISEGGCYIITNKIDKNEKYLILVSGDEPFLVKEMIWDCYKNIIVTNDILRGKDFYWEMKNDTLCL
jgi:hypothetical protein